MIDPICWHRPSAKQRAHPPSLLARVDARRIGQRHGDRYLSLVTISSVFLGVQRQMRSLVIA
jgi:hypothetical protein